ncbi:MAG: FKBP-type peptidyl-prolyl cis-trans isomerase [Desulforhopalus sp.]
MKKNIVSGLLAICLAVPAVSWSAAPASFEEKLSYSMGYEVGNYFKNAGGDIQKDFLVSGIEDAFKDASPQLTEEEMLAVKKEFAQKMQDQQMAKMEEMKAKNKAAGTAYLEENKKKEGVTVTDSGLQYEVLKKGEGEKAKPSDTVKVEYVGTLIDGTEFDSTAKHGEPAEFQVGQVIKGWSEALQLMNPGSKLRLVIPSELAYGENGAAPMIEPNSVLVFEVELLSIEK